MTDEGSSHSDREGRENRDPQPSLYAIRINKKGKNEY